MTLFDDAHSEILRLARERRYEDAIKKCEEQVQSWPQSHQHEAFRNLAYVQSVSGDLRAAVATMTYAIALAPSCLGHRHARAEWALELHEYDTVVSDTTALLEIERADGTEVYMNEASVLRAFALMKIGKPVEALRDLASVNNEGPFRICQSLWTRTSLISSAEDAARGR